MMENDLSKRLEALACLVRSGARLIDVGTDHAYLPVYLVRTGKVGRALASDIAKGPIGRAQAHIKEAGLDGTIETRMTPGLTGVEDFAPTDIVIAGMGGELIAQIIDEAPFVRNGKIRLILQPMTKQDVLRGYLTGAGFEIQNEKLVREGDRVYQVFCACFTGEQTVLTALEATVGKENLENGGETLLFLLGQKRLQLQKAIEGKKKGREDPGAEEELLGELLRYTERFFQKNVKSPEGA